MGPVMQHTGEFEPETLELHVFEGDGDGVLYEDDGHSLEYQAGAWRVSRFELRSDAGSGALTRHVEGPFRPGYQGYDVFWHTGNADRPAGATVTVDGRALTVTGLEQGVLRIPASNFERIEIRWS
jgi:hypothetical protein